MTKAVTVGPQLVNVDDWGMQYEITVTNNGPNTATNVVLKDFLPPNPIDVIYDTTNLPLPPGFVCNDLPGDVIECTLPNILDGETTIIKIKVIVDSLPATNSVEVTSDTKDNDLGNNQDSVMSTG